MDKLITSFRYHTRAIMDSAKTYADLALMECCSKIVVDFLKLAQFIKWSPKCDKELYDEKSNRLAFEILPQSQLLAIAEFLEGKTTDQKRKAILLLRFILDFCRFI